MSWAIRGRGHGAEAVQFSVVSGGADVRDLVVYATHDGDPAGEVSGDELANWAGIDPAVREASAGGAAAYQG